jgi:hypothetical protein
MRDHRDHIPKDDRELLREIDMTMFNSRGFRIRPKERKPSKPVQTKIGQGGSKAAKILRRQR